MIIFTPQTKNPTIAKFFREIGRFEELGSGVRNIFKYTKFYSNGKQPELLEGDIFKITIPIAEIQHYDIEVEDGELNKNSGSTVEKTKDTVYSILSENLTEAVKSRLAEIVSFLNNNKESKVSDLLARFNVSERTIRGNLKTLINSGLITYRGSKKASFYELSFQLQDKLQDKRK